MDVNSIQVKKKKKKRLSNSLLFLFLGSLIILPVVCFEGCLLLYVGWHQSVLCHAEEEGFPWTVVEGGGTQVLSINTIPKQILRCTVSGINQNKAVLMSNKNICFVIKKMVKK